MIEAPRRILLGPASSALGRLPSAGRVRPLEADASFSLHCPLLPERGPLAVCWLLLSVTTAAAAGWCCCCCWYSAAACGFCLLCSPVSSPVLSISLLLLSPFTSSPSGFLISPILQSSSICAACALAPACWSLLPRPRDASCLSPRSLPSLPPRPLLPTCTSPVLFRDLRRNSYRIFILNVPLFPPRPSPLSLPPLGLLSTRAAPSGSLGVHALPTRAGWTSPSPMLNRYVEHSMTPTMALPRRVSVMAAKARPISLEPPCRWHPSVASETDIQSPRAALCSRRSN